MKEADFGSESCKEQLPFWAVYIPPLLPPLQHRWPCHPADAASFGFMHHNHEQVLQHAARSTVLLNQVHVIQDQSKKLCQAEIPAQLSASSAAAFKHTEQYNKLDLQKGFALHL